MQNFANGKVAVGGQFLRDLRRLRDVVIPEGVERIGDKWFAGSWVESVEIPASITEIGESAFFSCKRLKRVAFKAAQAAEAGVGSASQSPKSSLRVIGKAAFCDCTNLCGIEFPDGLEEVGINAFRETGLASAEFPASLRKVAQGAFAGCRSLKEIRFKDGLEALGTDQYLDDGKLYYGAFQNSVVEYVELPATLKRIEYSAFEGCKALKSITLPEGLEFIGKMCF